MSLVTRDGSLVCRSGRQSDPCWLIELVAYYLAGLDRDNPDVFYITPYDRKDVSDCSGIPEDERLGHPLLRAGCILSDRLLQGKMAVLRSFGDKTSRSAAMICCQQDDALSDTALFQSPVFHEDGKILTVTAAMSKQGNWPNSVCWIRRAPRACAYLRSSVRDRQFLLRPAVEANFPDLTRTDILSP